MKQCASAGCGVLVSSGRCVKHRVNTHRPSSIRESAHKRGYTTRWRKVAKTYLATHPLCVSCLLRSETRLAVDVDHIIPHRGDPELFWDVGNWQGLCKPCHAKKTRAGL
jgi:5-methylcytosine-specific restriction protein A